MDLFDRTAGEIVNRTSKNDAASTRLVERGAGGLMDAIAYEVDVQERACFMSGLSLTFSRVRRSYIGGGRVSHLVISPGLVCYFRFSVANTFHWVPSPDVGSTPLRSGEVNGKMKIPGPMHDRSSAAGTSLGFPCHLAHQWNHPTHQPFLRPSRLQNKID